MAKDEAPPDDQAQKAVMGDPEHTDVPEREEQTIRRMPADIDVGPYFPSGMSAPEAAMAGATAGMSDADREKINKEAERSGLVTPRDLVQGAPEEEDDRDE